MNAAGVDIGGTKALAALVDPAGKILEQVGRETDNEAGTATIISVLADLMEARPGEVGAVGVAVAAYVSYPEGRVAFAPNLNYEDPNVLDAVSSKFDLSTAVENDGAAAAWGEWTFGAGKGSSNMLMVTVGTGVGGGIIIGGNLYRGAGGFAAEFGHMTIEVEGPACACGERGCLEALASGTAVSRMAREAVRAHEQTLILEIAGEDTSKITGAMVAEAARAGDSLALRILERAGRSLGVGLASLANAFDPEVIVVGGGAADDVIIDSATHEMTTRIKPRREPPGVVVAKLGNDAGVIGVADLARRAAMGDN